MAKIKNTRKSKPFIISKEELETLMESTHDRDRLIMVALGFAGLREGELAHMHKSWVHSKYIEIPEEPQLCNCVDCQLQAYFAKKRGAVKKDVDWYPKLQKKFYKQRKAGKLKALKHQWSPASEDGARTISYTFPGMRKTFRRWFKTHDSIGMTRQGIWQRVRTLGNKILGKKLYPHSLRMSAATILADNGASSIKLKESMGWAKIDSALHYVESEKKRIKRKHK